MIEWAWACGAKPQPATARSAMLSVELLPEAILTYHLSSIIESLKCLLMMGLLVFNNFKIVSWTKRLSIQIL